MTIDPSLRWGLLGSFLAFLATFCLFSIPDTISYQNTQGEAKSEATDPTEYQLGEAFSTTTPFEEPIMPVPLPYVPRETEWKYPELKRICACESGWNADGEPQQYDQDGNVLRGNINPQDVGQCQINLFYHQEAAERLGLDLFTPDGNKSYAEYLYEQQGSKPWTWSAACWQS